MGQLMLQQCQERTVNRYMIVPIHKRNELLSLTMRRGVTCVMIGT